MASLDNGLATERQRLDSYQGSEAMPTHKDLLEREQSVLRSVIGYGTSESEAH